MPRLLVIALVALVVGVGVGGVMALRRPQSAMVPGASAERSSDAFELFAAEKYTEVAAVTSLQLIEFPLDASALSLRGFATFYLSLQAVELDVRIDLLQRSVRDLRRALLVADQNMLADINYVLGKSYFHLGEHSYDSTVVHLTTARELGIERLDVLEYLALANRGMGQLEASVVRFREAIEMGDQPVHRVVLAEVLLDLERYGEADALLARAVQQTNDLVLVQDALILSGRSFRDQDRIVEAEAVYREILGINPSSAEAHFGLGEVYLATEQQEAARFEWREAVRLDPNHIESLQRLQDY